MSKAFYNRWVTPGDETTIPAIVDSYVKSSQLGSINPYSAYNYSTERVAKGDFLRVKTVSLTYDLSGKWIERTNFFKSASVTAALSNFWMIYADKKLNRQDPEFFNTGGVATPIQKQVTFALKLTF
jgi:hypothetical protein